MQGFNAFERSVRQAIEDGKFLPLSVYDPESSCSHERYPMLSGVVAGATKEEVLLRLHDLQENGLIELKP